MNLTSNRKMKNLFVYLLFVHAVQRVQSFFGQRCAPQFVQQYQFCIDISKKQTPMTIIPGALGFEATWRPLCSCLLTNFQTKMFEGHQEANQQQRWLSEGRKQWAKFGIMWDNPWTFKTST